MCQTLINVYTSSAWRSPEPRPW